MSEDQAETKPKVENAAAVINLVVKDSEGEVHFKVQHTSFHGLDRLPRPLCPDKEGWPR
jgi:hypothetical protein